MTDNLRIDDLRRRIQTDPASIAFAQLAEECRRVGEHQEAVDVCRAGLAIHPGYMSARVTLGRSLIQLNRLDEATVELQQVLATAPDNLAAIRGLAQIHERHGQLADALIQYQAALLLTPNDPELEQTVARLSRQAAGGQEPLESRGAPVLPDPAPRDDEREKAARTVVALEEWLHAIHVARADRRA
jgi:tetratricopeptide (TPR) repeat protein